MTLYRFAKSSKDFKKCHDLLKKEDKDLPLTNPTLLAIRDDKVVGFITLTFQKHYPVIHTLYVDVKPGAFIAKALIQLLESFLVVVGCRGYLFGIDKGTKWSNAIQKMGFKPYKETSSRLFYARRFYEDL